VEIKKRIVEQLKNPMQKTTDFNLTKKDFEKTQVTSLQRQKRRTTQQNGITLQQCNRCGEYKTSEKFSKYGDSIRTECKICHNKNRHERRNTPYGFVKGMITHAKHNANRRAIKRKRRDDESGEIDKNLFDIVVDKIIEQKGCCAVSGNIFIFKLNSPFQPSIDRLDNSKGYVKENIRIVISPVNNPGRG